MKAITGILILFVALSASAEKMDDFPRQVSDQFELRKLKSKHLRDIDLKAQSATIFTMLAYTQELRIHQMGGAIGNQVFLHEDGHKEAVYDGEGALVTDCLNQASYNYYHPYQYPLAHFTADILPWLMWGNCKNDPSSKAQRIEAYISDLRLGFDQAIKSNQGFFLPEKFNFKGYGQSATISFYLKALESSSFDFGKFVPKNLHDKQQQELFFQALEEGFNALLKSA